MESTHCGVVGDVGTCKYGSTCAHKKNRVIHLQWQDLCVTGDWLSSYELLEF